MSDDDAECPTCGRTFATETRMRRHAESAHGGVAREVPWKKVGAALAVGAVAVAAWSLFAGGGGSAGSLMAEFAADDDPYLGNASAPVTVVTFESPACPACRAYHDRMFPGIKSDYIETGQVAYYYSQFPAGYRFDKPGSIAQQCVYEHVNRTAFFSFTTDLYTRFWKSSADRVDDHIRAWSQDHGVDPQPVISCYSNGDTAADYESDVAAGRSNGVPGTPHFFVWGPEGEATSTGAGGLEDAIRNKLPSSGGSG